MARTGVARRRIRTGRYVAGVVLALVCLAAILDARAMLRAAAVLYSFSSKRPPWSVQLYERYFHYAASVQDLTIPASSGGPPIFLQTYTPIGRQRPPTIVVVHGIVGNEAEPLIRLALALAHQGFRVVLPTLPGEAQLDIARSDMQIIADTIVWASRTGRGEKVSVFGVSFGGGLTIVGAEQPEARSHVRLILSISGYNDLNTIAQYYTLESLADPAGRPYPQKYDKLEAIFFLKQYLGEMVPREDVRPIEAVLMPVFRSDRFPVRAGDPTLRSLTPAQQALFVHLELIDTPEVRQRYRDLIARHHDDFLAVSPKSVLPNLDIPLYVLHATSDQVIPEGEVEWMKQEVPPGADVHFLTSTWMQHGQISNPVTSMERFRVGSFVATVLSRAAEN